MKNNPEPVRVGQSFDDFLKEQGILEETTAAALARVAEWQRQVSRNKAKPSREPD